MSASGVLEEEHVPAALDLGEVPKNAAPSAPLGGTAIVTTLRHRSGANAAAPYVAVAPQSWPMITASPSPPSASWKPIASTASMPVW